MSRFLWASAGFLLSSACWNLYLRHPAHLVVLCVVITAGQARMAWSWERRP